MFAVLLLLFLTVQAKNDTSVEVKDEVRIKKAEQIVTSTMMSVEKMKQIKEDEEKKIAEVKAELERVVTSLNTTQGAKPLGPVTPIPLPGLQTCGPLDCNNRGTCLGTRSSYFCACQFGFSGRSCEETMCDSARDCNGRGICLGTSSAVTCLCNLGYGGPRCETAF